MAKLKAISCLLCIGWFFADAAFAQSPVTVSVDTHSPGFLIPEDFAGIGFETWAELPNVSGVSGRLFSPDNTQLITLFTNTGIRNLRLGGGTVDNSDLAVPSHADIDSVFGFARAADIKVIYSFRLLNGDAAEDAAIAKYIWDHYRANLDCFSIGNEPNEPPYRRPKFGALTNYADFLSAWRKFAAVITQSVPDAKFTGPESGGWDWVGEFANDEKSSGRVVLITHHEYAGGKPFINHGKKEMPASQAIDNMLSPNWLTNEYVRFYNRTLALVAPTGLPCRMTEANDYLRGVTNASDAFASALWALDYMHWWAAHGCAGINFHNNQHTTWLKTDTFFLDSATREFRINPKAYAIRAFDLGSHGCVKPIAIGNTNGLNLTAYAVGDGTNQCVTIINKEHGTGARTASVTINCNSVLKDANVMFLTAPDNDAGATNGITLGGSLITNHAPWHGQWTVLPASDEKCELTVPSASAAVVRFTLANKKTL